MGYITLAKSFPQGGNLGKPGQRRCSLILSSSFFVYTSFGLSSGGVAPCERLEPRGFIKPLDAPARKVSVLSFYVFIYFERIVLRAVGPPA